jgi:hypothetical protein
LKVLEFRETVIESYKYHFTINHQGQML